MQNTINDIVKAFSETPFSVRTNFETLKLISEHWSNLDRSLFDSDQHFIVTSAKVTDHLLRLLMSVKNEKELIYLMDISSLMNITNKIDYNKEALIFEKILLEVDEDLLNLYGDSFNRYCSNCDGPQKQMEVVDLLNARRYVYINKRLKTQVRFTRML